MGITSIIRTLSPLQFIINYLHNLDVALEKYNYMQYSYKHNIYIYEKLW